MQPALFDRDVGRVRDPLARVYTPASLAVAIVEDLAIGFRRHGTGGVWPMKPVIIEPALGGGAFARAARAAWPKATIIGVDIDPDCEGKGDVDEFILGDWLEVAQLERWRDEDARIDLILTNPPYTRLTGRKNPKGEDISESVIGLHIDACRSVAESVCSLLLPAATVFAGPDAEPREALDRHVPGFVHRVAGRPWPFLREAAVFQWNRYDAHQTVIPTKAITSPTGRWT